MAQITPNMNLTIWNLLSDPYNHQQLADNFIKLDQHDHSGNGMGAQIDGGSGIKRGTIGRNQLGAGSVTSAAIAPKSINDDSIVDQSITGSKKIKNGTITGDLISSGAIENNKIASNTITLDKLATKVIPNFEKSSPSVISPQPEDGESYYYSPDPANSVVWNMRYRTEVGRWEFVGGSPLTALQTKTTTVADTDGITMKAAAAIKLLPGKYLITANIHFNAVLDVKEDNPQIRCGFYESSAGSIVANNNPKKAADPYNLMSKPNRRTLEFTRQSDTYNKPNEQSTITLTSIFTVTDYNMPVKLFVGKNSSITTASFDSGIITATPFYLK